MSRVKKSAGSTSSGNKEDIFKRVKPRNPIIDFEAEDDLMYDDTHGD